MTLREIEMIMLKASRFGIIRCFDRDGGQYSFSFTWPARPCLFGLSAA